MVGNQAGMFGVLAALATGCKILSAVSYSESVSKLLARMNIPVAKNIHDSQFIRKLKTSDLLLCVHGREIVPQKILDLPKSGAVNVHPYLHKYKGADPIGRALKDGDFHASVGAHRMSAEVDAGDILVEEFLEIGPADSVEEVYNRLYPVYVQVILKTLEVIKKNLKKGMQKDKKE